MRLELLKAGDWVRNSQSGEFIQITIETFRNHHNYESGEPSKINFSMLEPIKLSDILDTENFTDIGNSKFKYRASDITVEYRNNRVYVTIPNVISSTMIFYVHQLQQLFRNTGHGYLSAQLKLL